MPDQAQLNLTHLCDASNPAMERTTINNWWTEARQFGIATVQLALLLVVLRQFQIESNAFLRIAVLAFGGFVIHYFLPASLRLPFFSILSLAGIAIVLVVTTVVWLVRIVVFLMVMCHFLVRFR